MHVVDTAAREEEIGIPSWIKSSFRRTEGRDPLGLQSITIDRIMPRLVPSILALSRRARYLSFYPFLLDEVRRHQLTSSQDSLSDFIKHREFEFGLAVALCPRCRDRATSVVGGRRVGPRIGSDATAFAREESVESYLGGYGLYYRTPLLELSVVAPRGEVLQSGELLPLDVVRPDAGIELADHFRAAIEDTPYYQEYFYGSQPTIPRQVLEDLSARSCLCRLDTFTDERAAIREVLLGLPGLTSERSTFDAERRAAAEQRRLSVALVLWVLDRAPWIVLGSRQAEHGFRHAVWDEFAARVGKSSMLVDALAQWAALAAKDYAQEALASIWAEFCRRGYAEQPLDGMLPVELDRFLRSELFTGAVVDVGGDHLTVDPAGSTQTLAHALVNHMATLSLEDIRAWAARRNTAVSGLVLLLELRNRIVEPIRAHARWRAIAQLPSNWQPGLIGLLAALDQHLDEDPTVADTLAWLTERFILHVHERVAYSKLPQFTFRFHWEEERLRFYDLDPSRFILPDIRLDAISRLSEDLGLLDPTGDSSVLTAEGRAFVEEVLG